VCASECEVVRRFGCWCCSGPESPPKFEDLITISERTKIHLLRGTTLSDDRRKKRVLDLACLLPAGGLSFEAIPPR